MPGVRIFPSGDKVMEVRKRFNSGKSLQVLYRGKDYEIVKDFRGKEKFIAARKIVHTGDFVWRLRIVIRGDDVMIESDDESANPFEINVAIAVFDDFELHKDDKNHIFLDVTDVETIEIRSFLPGDRVRSGNMDRKLKKIMIDNKCSDSEKKSVPLFVVNGKILSAGFGFVQRGSHRIADIARVSRGSKKILDIYRICAES